MGIRSIRWPQDREAILDHIRLVHGLGDYELLAAWYGDFPGFDPADCLVIEGEDGAIVAHGMLIPRQLQIGPSELATAEIGLLGALDAQGGGAAQQALLAALHARMTARGDVLGLSFGAPGPFDPWQYEPAVGLYLTSYESELSTASALRAGFWDAQHGYERRTADRLGARNQAVEVRVYHPADLPALQALYRAAGARGYYCLARDEATWRWQLDFLARVGRNAPGDFLVAEAEGELVAYARLVTQTPINVFRDTPAARCSVIEVGGEHPDGLEALLHEIGRLAQAADVDRIGLFVHPASAFMAHALARGGCLRHFTGAGALRLHDLPGALAQLVPALEARRQASAYAPRAYRLVLRTEQDEAAVALGVGEAEEVTLEAPAGDLVRLFTGWFGLDHLTIGYHPRHADLLRVLFPRRDPKIGLADLV